MDLDHVFSSMVDDLFWGNDEDQVATDILGSLEGPEEVPLCVQSIKEEGNFLFRKGHVHEAWVFYVRAAKVVPLGEEDKIRFRELAFSLNLNLAACAIKIRKFDLAKHLCSFVLQFDENNVKTLYRRGVACFELGLFEESLCNLIKAAKIEPSNQDVKRELQKVGLVKLSPKDESCSGDDACCEESVRDKPTSSEVCDQDSDQLTQNSEDMDVSCVSEGNCPPPTCVDDEMKGERSCSGDSEVKYSGDDNRESESYSPCQNNNVSIETDILKEPKFRFNKRQGRGSSLHIPRSIYERLAGGDELCFFDRSKHCMMKIKAMNSCTRALENDVTARDKVLAPCEMMDHSDHSSAPINQEPLISSLSSCHHQQVDVPMDDEVTSKYDSKKHVFYFNCKPKHYQRIMKGTLTPLKLCSSAREHLQNCKSRRKRLLSFINQSCGCRLSGCKRKDCHQFDDEVLVRVPPRQKMKSFASNDGCCISCFSYGQVTG